LGGFGLPLFGAVTVQAGDLGGPQQAQFDRLNRAGHQLPNFAAAAVRLVGLGCALGLEFWVRREKRRSA